MHADQQMAFAIDVLQPTVDQIVSRLEIQSGERFIEPKKIDFPRSRDDFGKEDPRFLTVAFGKKSYISCSSISRPASISFPKARYWALGIEALNNLARGQAGREINVIGEVESRDSGLAFRPEAGATRPTSS